VNSPRGCVLAGRRDAIRDVMERLDRRGAQGRLLPSRHAFHTPLLDEAGGRLAELLGGLALAAPAIPLVANLTGTWATGELTDPGYWHRQLTAPVLFGPALATAAKRCGILLEIGPGQLRTLAVQARSELGGAAIATVRREYQNEADAAVLLRALGRLWRAGVEPAWRALRPDHRPRRASLPPTATDARRLCVADGGSAGLGAPPIRATNPAAEPAAAAAEPAASDLEAVLAELWTEILGSTGLRPADDFFDLGGDSMMSVQLILGIERRLGVHVPAVEVFAESTLGGMARQVRAWRERSTR
jgi:acyl transferase domain-containing protein